VFTGIIEKIGTVREFQKLGETGFLDIAQPELSAELALGESVSVNGVCLTVRGKNSGTFEAELSNETLARSSLGLLKSGDFVNLERSLLPTTRLGGHFVQGHVDGIAHVLSIRADGGFAQYQFSLPSQLQRYVVEKGSIAVDGISLTVAQLQFRSFEVAIIPHTFGQTNLSSRSIGDVVNLECDVLAKYVESLLGSQKERPEILTEQYLKDRGY
jgi:riboflavin synthase